MLRRPLQSPLFPTRRSSDLSKSRTNLKDHGPGHTRQYAAGKRRGANGIVLNPEKIAARRFHNKAVRVQQQRFISSGRIRRSEEHTSELQSRFDLVCRLLLEK